MSHRDILMQVKELLGKQLTAKEISNRLYMDIDIIENAISRLKVYMRD
jgi:DNA-binding CsgD family transcriptional regulator